MKNTQDYAVIKYSKKTIGIIPFLVFFLSLTSFSKTYYVATTGNDANPGTKAKPVATVQHAQDLVVPGDTVYIRGGTYMMQESQINKTASIYAYVINLNKSGTSGKRIYYWGYPGEKPIFDFSNVKPADLRVLAFYVTGSWLHFKGFEVVGVQVTILTHTQSESFENRGSNNIYEQLAMHDSQAIGIYCIAGANNLFLNCDAYQNHDYTSEGGRGGNTDGFGCHTPKGGSGNVFRGCRSWFNSDDGYDLINEHEDVVFENCWAFYNGYSTTFATLGDGNGFKAGGYGATPAADLPNPIPNHTVRNCLSVQNGAAGFYRNHHIGGGFFINNTAYRNGNNYNMLCRLSDNVTDVPGYGITMKNNLGYKARSNEVVNLDKPKCTLNNNYFDLSVTVSDADFLSLDQSELIQPRKADGSLPDIKFMHLVKGSDLIDAGVITGYPYSGNKPDLGCFEYGASIVTDVDIVGISTENGVSAFPNPFAQELELKAIGEFTYAIYDLSGAEVEKGTGENTAKAGSTLRPGMYLVKIQLPSGGQVLKISKN
jgi:hypothetical protein